MHITTVDRIIDTADRLDATIPKPVLNKWKKLTALRIKASNIDLGTVDLPAAILNAMEKGNDVATDPGVQQAVTVTAIGDVQRVVNSRLDARVRDFAIENAPAILEGFRTPFDKAASVIRKSQEVLGDVALEDSRAVLSRGGDAAALWAESQEADKVIADIRTSWKLMGTVAPTGLPDARHALMVICDLPPHVFIDEQPDPKMRAWDVARRGWPLALATPESIREQIDVIAQERQQREVQAQGAFAKEHQRTRGIGASR